MAKNVLVLGAGMVSGPCVDYLLRNQYSVTVVSAIETELQHVTDLFPSVKVIHLDVAVEILRLKDVISHHNVIISILPAHLHPQVIQCCIDSKKSLVHASYEDQYIRDVSESAKSAGITILSEAGLDPGIDHMLAMNCIDSIKEQKGQVTGYSSLCGGLPAPESSSGPLRYKFSWYPKGMFISAMQKARFIRNGQVIEVPEGHIFDRAVTADGIVEDCIFEDLPNRDSTKYMKIYNIQSASTVYRGTLRYQGFSCGMKTLISLGLTSNADVSHLFLDSSKICLKELVCKLHGIPQNASEEEIKDWLKSKLDFNQIQLDTVTELGLLRDTEIYKLSTPLDMLCAYLTKKLAYGPDERDMVVMRNIIQAAMPDGEQVQHTFDLVEMGQVYGYTAMARTVGLTVAVCASLLMKGVITEKGAILPITKDIYEPALKLLALEGIHIRSTITKLN